MRKKKRTVVWILLIACLAFGCYETAAYMSDSKQAVNHLKFIGDKGMNAVLVEPSWNPQNAIRVIPGTVISKDPMVQNVSEADIDELVALQCKFVYTSLHPDKSRAGKALSAQDMEKVLKVYEIDYNSDSLSQKEWVRFDKEKKTDPVQHFYYTRTLRRNLPKAGDFTAPLFTRIMVAPTVNSKEQDAVKMIGGFEIQITGQVLQQMDGEQEWGLASAANAYRAGLFHFSE